MPPAKKAAKAAFFAVFLKRQWVLRYIVIASMLSGVSTGHAQALLFDGDFESGTLAGWAPGTQGTAILAASGRCFSDQDTTALSIRGKYAGLLRGSEQLKPGAAASLSSKPFTAGKGFLFLALTERHTEIDPNPPSYTLLISVLDSNGETLSRHELNTARASLSHGCPSLPGDQRFSEHFISTQKYLGQTIKLRFSQHPMLARSGNFSLIDQISIVQQGEVAAYSDKPAAVAGIEYDVEHDFLYLIAKIPQHELENNQDWIYSWRINAQTGVRVSYKVCINDLKPGNHTANLSVQKATALSTDTLHFYVPERLQQAVDSDMKTDWAACKTTQQKSAPISSSLPAEPKTSAL